MRESPRAGLGVKGRGWAGMAGMGGDGRGWAGTAGTGGDGWGWAGYIYKMWDEGGMAAVDSLDQYKQECCACLLQIVAMRTGTFNGLAELQAACAGLAETLEEQSESVARLKVWERGLEVFDRDCRAYRACTHHACLAVFNLVAPSVPAPAQ